jgi:uncharacterized membrane protein
MRASAVDAKVSRHDQRSGLVSLGRSLVINGVGPYLVYCIAAPHFPPSSVAPLLLSAMVPGADLTIGVTRRRRIDAIAVIALSQLLVGVAIGLLTRSPGEALMGHALQPAALGLVFGLSTIAGRPLIEPLARQMIAGDDAERQARFDGKAILTSVRRIFVRLTLAWAAALGAESALLVIAIKLLPAQDYLLASSVINYAVYGLLVWGSLRYGRIKAAASVA